MKRCSFAMLGFVLAFGASAMAGAQTPEDSYWVEPMRKVHARFSGRPGTFAHFGDSITVSLAFWTPLLYEPKNMSAPMREALDLVKGYMRKECWRDWKGPAFGNEGSMTIRWAFDNVDKWLKDLNPETALIMFGTNDLHALELDEYRDKTRAVVRKCLDHGTAVLLSTIPPRHGYDAKAATFAEALRAIAREEKVPLVDYHAAILERRPDDWDGATEQFAAFKDYDVPTLISRDGVHPSNPKAFENDYSPEALRSNGFNLRSYVVLLRYADVIRRVLKAEKE